MSTNGFETPNSLNPRKRAKLLQIYNFSDYLTKYMHFKKIASNYTSFKWTFIQAKMSIITRYILTSKFIFFHLGAMEKLQSVNT